MQMNTFNDICECTYNIVLFLNVKKILKLVIECDISRKMIM